MKVYCLFAGVNGSGKSTIYHSNPAPFEEYVRINTDETLRSMNGDWKNPIDVSLAGKITVKMLKQAFLKEKSICQETTLTGKSIVRNIIYAKQNGYIIKIYYMGLESADLAVSRVQKRISEGGHGISEEDIRRRYENSLNNLISVIPYCDKLYVYDNSFENSRPKRILSVNFITSQKNVSHEIPDWGTHLVDVVNSACSLTKKYDK
ncbi:MAG: zeta toxin family protein [Clostridiales bacterium]|nr:zeta toxin family protein [Clostridiales bacterium]